MHLSPIDFLVFIHKNTPCYRYKDSHYKHETVVRQSETYNGDSFTRKTAYFVSFEGLISLINWHGF